MKSIKFNFLNKIIKITIQIYSFFCNIETKENYMELKAFQINTTKDVKRFFYYLKNDAKLDFKPGDDFKNYFQIIKRKPKFSNAEAKALDKVFRRCARTCHKKRIDIEKFSLNLNMKDLVSELEKDIKGMDS